MENLLEIKDLSAEFKTERATIYALNGVNLSIAKGESLGLVGEAGAGKTTTALSILNLLPKPAGRFTGGDILWEGRSVFSMKEKELENLRGGKISMIFQNPLTALNPVFTVGEQIAMVLRKHAGMKNREAKERASELLELVGIKGERIKEYPNQFSGGMRQRVGIASALACNPELLIADEPTTALDVTIQAQILELMKELQTKYNSSLLMITHNLGIVSELCQKVAIMYAGRIIEYGTVREVFKNPVHPYTKGLLGAIPCCSFSPRCEGRCEACLNSIPPMREVKDGHFVACICDGKGGV